jgi:hypothetical protein
MDEDNDSDDFEFDDDKDYDWMLKSSNLNFIIFSI